MYGQVLNRIMLFLLAQEDLWFFVIDNLDFHFRLWGPTMAVPVEGHLIRTVLLRIEVIASSVILDLEALMKNES